MIYDMLSLLFPLNRGFGQVVYCHFPFIGNNNDGIPTLRIKNY